MGIGSSGQLVVAGSNCWGIRFTSGVIFDVVGDEVSVSVLGM